MMEQWWKKSVVYQIYVRSFQDSNHDGIGDINGITSRLDYLEKLGVDVLWLTPIYESPNDDNGYDISDYRNILDEYGTMEDFDRLLLEAHQRGIKIVMDLVFNHTSDKHKWFIESQSSKDNPYRDYYIWKDPKDGDVPSNWTSCFQGSAWQYDEATQQYYLHLFSKKQPDLNWQNPKVREECFDIMNYWVDKGVDGFRLDVINLISKDEDKYYTDSDIKGHQVCANGPHIHDYLQEMNQQVLSRKPLLTVGETPAVTIEDGIKFAPLDGRELSMIFQFEMMNVDGAEVNKWTDQRFELLDLKRIMTRWQVGLYQKAWNSLFWNNHDQPRCVSRFGDVSTPFYHEKSAKMLAICLHMMQGTPYIYQGEELGMTNVPFESLEDYRDIESFNSYKQLVEIEKTVKHEDMLRYLRKSSRDNARTPMQWDETIHAGFSDQEPWIMVNPNYLTLNASAQLSDPNSIFYTYQKLIQLRKDYDIITDGKYQLIMEDDPHIYAYKRISDHQELIIYCNFSSQELDYDCSYIHDDAKILISNYDDCAHKLRAYESLVFIQNI
ncbi:MAG: alpha-glucosidase [Coprobacillus cateniformis]|nr:alpha-glucosidase [Coprobacillus cateniformis]PWM87674.1 MAG: alpha-glucosidase [Coprobacillus sp.]MVX26669.1 alpha,alpha-phosphotrehalase [Coprobacillus cateniformis]RGO10328.1 alpha-glucosidase [Coprobacillus cateniformis]RGO19135.1 alpha-glucosidase [Coprobacillus cateniformis]